LANSHPINPGAYQLYLKGRYHWNKRSMEGFQKAIEYFQLAAAKDPSLRAGLRGFGRHLHLFFVFRRGSSAGSYAESEGAAARALEIDNHLGEAHVSLGYVSYMYDWDWAAAGKHFEQALTLNPAYSSGPHLLSFLSQLSRTVGGSLGSGETLP
jgi:hypothetical protein